MCRAIVTGGSRGIGRAVASAILGAGGRVMITGRDKKRVDAAVTELAAGVPSRDDRVAGLAVDVRNRAAVEDLVQTTVERFGGIDTLVNNAGVGAFANVAETTDEDWNRVIDTNLTGVFLCTRAAIPALRRNGGWIINVASLAGRNYFPGGAAYCASKAALIAFSECLMQEVRYDNIRVSVILPGSVATEFSGSGGGDVSWKLTGDDVAEVVMDLLRHPGRSLPSLVEIRPSKPARK